MSSNPKSPFRSLFGAPTSPQAIASKIPFDPTNEIPADNVQDAIEYAQANANAKWIDGLPVTMVGAADKYVLMVSGTPGDEQVVAVPGVSAGIPASAVRRYMDSTTEIINGVTYYQVKSTPPAPAAVPVTVVNTVTTAATFNLITQFTSVAQTEQLQIQEGLWAFRLWLQASNANCTLVAQVSKLNTTTFVKTLIHNASWPVPDTSLQQFAFDFEQPAPITINTNERIVLELMCFSPAAGRTLALTFDGIDRQSYVDVPLALLHNSLSQLQGGAGNERFHSTAAQNALLVDLEAAGLADWITEQGQQDVNGNSVRWRRFQSGRVEQFGTTFQTDLAASGVTSKAVDFAIAMPGPYQINMTVSGDVEGQAVTVCARAAGALFAIADLTNLTTTAQNVSVHWRAISL